ncbi:putative disease resistance protein [Senna tora]|uniref:Putative disease resistance protein n=1 Tax=Senna tora TaxID=362788 RepID=A0A835CI94_9FABA|nr:putative disease resistance protein [Senna tora]
MNREYWEGLLSIKSEVAHSIEQMERTDNVWMKRVVIWMDQVDALGEKIKDIEGKALEEVEKKWLSKSCAKKCVASYKVGKKVLEMLKEVCKLTEKGKEYKKEVDKTARTEQLVVCLGGYDYDVEDNPIISSLRQKWEYLLSMKEFAESSGQKKSTHEADIWIQLLDFWKDEVEALREEIEDIIEGEGKEEIENKWISKSCANKVRRKVRKMLKKVDEAVGKGHKYMEMKYMETVVETASDKQLRDELEVESKGNLFNFGHHIMVTDLSEGKDKVSTSLKQRYFTQVRNLVDSSNFLRPFSVVNSIPTSSNIGRDSSFSTISISSDIVPFSSEVNLSILSCSRLDITSSNGMLTKSPPLTSNENSFNFFKFFSSIGNFEAHMRPSRDRCSRRTKPPISVGSSIVADQLFKDKTFSFFMY